MTRSPKEEENPFANSFFFLFSGKSPDFALLSVSGEGQKNYFFRGLSVFSSFLCVFLWEIPLAGHSHD